jgi:hypothetical protein
MYIIVAEKNKGKDFSICPHIIERFEVLSTMSISEA